MTYNQYDDIGRGAQPESPPRGAGLILILGALFAPLVGVAGSHDALPMAIIIGACGISALAVNLVFSHAAPAPAAEGEPA